jgi:hypothetical protein
MAISYPDVSFLTRVRGWGGSLGGGGAGGGGGGLGSDSTRIHVLDFNSVGSPRTLVIG